MDKSVVTNDWQYVEKVMLKMAAATVENKGVQKLLNDLNEHFDVVIVERFFSDLLARYVDHAFDYFVKHYYIYCEYQDYMVHIIDLIVTFDAKRKSRVKKKK